ncbi:Gfo/Idh/MocA family protein [Amycolatopsis thermophila]|uniref:Dehydrogenase n=1 Tax=Amycolatopsis thermophila TaxID=206084 RepID=A0ABU0F314_9PSEU|nr:Gfo/Idh/MocA family oxidoreductase [Amycolatopsis thermophila]MDQ0381926.1 putative dehydrogenase [Amycolatopsis thermophila]
MARQDAQRCRVGLIGAGTFGLRHSRFIARSDRAGLVAVADPTFGSDRPVPDELREVARYADHREMLARGDLDGVIVASPSEMHVAHALDCLDAGVAVLVEKPVAVDREQARPLLDRVAEDPRARVLVGHHRRHHPAVAAARSLIEEGRLGEIRAVAAVWATHKTDAYFEIEWRRRRPGGGMLLINLIHEVDLLRHLVGEITSVQAIASNKARGLEVEDTAGLALRFENGAIGTLVGSDSAVSPWGWDQATDDDPAFPYHPGQPCLLIAGSRGSVSVPDMTVFTQPEPSWLEPVAQSRVPVQGADAFARQLAHFADVAAGRARPLVTAEDALRSFEVVRTAAQSLAG